MRQRYLSLRAAITPTTISALASLELDSVLDLLVPDFAQWCTIDVVDQHGSLARRLTRHQGCPSADQSEHEQCCSSSLRARVDALSEVSARAFTSGASESTDNDGLATGVAVGIRINDEPFAVVTFCAHETPGYGAFEITVAEEVVWGVASALEAAMLHRDTRQAVRSAQKIASQLHQLIAASITLTGLRSEEEVLTSLAVSTRRVFDVDLAVVSLEAGALAPLRGVARRGKVATCLGDGDAPEGFPLDRPGRNAPWSSDGWLLAPILERRGVARGVVAVRRRDGQFTQEDEEVITLLAQMAATSIAAIELSRSIQRSESRWRILVDTAPAGIVEVDAEGRVRWWNQAAGRLFAWPAYDGSEGIQASLPDATITEMTPLWRRLLDGSVTGDSDIIEVDVRGRRRELTIAAALLPLGEGDSGRTLLMMIDDVTDHRQLKSEVRHAQQMELRGRVASSVAHDFNNLLTLISGYAEILTRDLVGDPHSLEMVREIQSTASRASRLTAQLQTIGRTKSLEPVVLNPVAVLQSNAEVLERIVGGDITLTWSLNPASASIRVDPGQFEQMVLNLAMNARDAMDHGGELAISVDDVSLDSGGGDQFGLAPGDYVVIKFTDTGTGMDDSTREQCFEPLFTTKGAMKGTGMGLAAARRLVEGSDGAITCDSQLGVGTTFEILLPAASSSAPTTTTEPPATGRHATVLVAEDDEGLRRLVTQALARAGYRVLEAESGERALEVLAEHDGPFDLLVSDVVMSDISGPELARNLQSLQPSLRVLMMSGTADAAILDELLPGIKGFLAKPFRPSELIARVDELLTRD